MQIKIIRGKVVREMKNKKKKSHGDDINVSNNEKRKKMEKSKQTTSLNETKKNKAKVTWKQCGKYNNGDCLTPKIVLNFRPV